MKKENLKKVPVEKLKKRLKWVSISIVLLLAAILLSAIVIIYDLVTGDNLNTTLFVSAAACFIIFIPNYLGKKKIQEELSGR